MKKFLTLAACAALLSGCDFVGGSGADPIAFSSVTLTSAPLPADDDGTAPDLYVEIQDAGGRAVYQSEAIQNADASAFPYVIARDGEFTGTNRGYYVVVMDQNGSSYKLIAASSPFTPNEIRTSTEQVIRVTNTDGTVQAEITVTR